MSNLVYRTTMNHSPHITDEYVRDRAEEDICAASGHRGNPIEGDAKVSADFENFSLSVGRDEQDGTTVFRVDGSADVHYYFREHVRTGEDSYELREWEKQEREDYELFYYIEDGRLIEGEL